MEVLCNINEEMEALMLSASEDSADCWRHCLSVNCLGCLSNNTEGSGFMLAPSGKHLIFQGGNA